MTETTDTSDLTQDGEGTPMEEAVASIPGADWEEHAHGVSADVRVFAGENPFLKLAGKLEWGVGLRRRQWSEEDIKDALRRALNEYDG